MNLKNDEKPTTKKFNISKDDNFSSYLGFYTYLSNPDLRNKIIIKNQKNAVPRLRSYSCNIESITSTTRNYVKGKKTANML